MLNWRDPKNPEAGGAERVTLAYLSELVKRGHEVFWFTHKFPGATSEEMIGGITIVRGGGKFTSIPAAIKWYHRQKPFDLVIDQHHGIPWFAPWWCGTNNIAYIHEVLGPIWSAFYPWPISAIGRWQERWTHWFYRRVPFWTPSDSTQKALRRHGIKKINIFPNGVDTKPLAELEQKRLGLPLKLIAVSRLAPNKRIDHAIRVVQALAERNVEANLRVIGTGELEPQLRRLVSTMRLGGRVSFAGLLREPEKETELRNAHLLVHTSLREGWGLTVIEANAMGTPAVVYPVGGLVDSTVDGVTGIVAKEETPRAIAEGIVQMLKVPEEYESYRRKAWERAKSLQWENVLPPVCDWLEAQAHGAALEKHSQPPARSNA
jgi:glycosyltransferase involved in cell wall biosynthesis